MSRLCRQGRLVQKKLKGVRPHTSHRVQVLTAEIRALQNKFNRLSRPTLTILSFSPSLLGIGSTIIPYRSDSHSIEAAGGLSAEFWTDLCDLGRSSPVHESLFCRLAAGAAFRISGKITIGIAISSLSARASGQPRWYRPNGIPENLVL